MGPRQNKFTELARALRARIPGILPFLRGFPQVRQTKLPGYSAFLVRGVDRFHYYEEETPATRDLDPAALAWRKQQDQLHFSIAGTS
jgi:hypothetical protein